MSLTTTPIRVNNFYRVERPHNPGGDAWRGHLTPTLELYCPLVSEQGWGEIIGKNFELLDGAMLRDWDQVITGVNEFKNRVAVRWPQADDEPTPRSYVERETRIWAAMVRR